MKKFWSAAFYGLCFFLLFGAFYTLAVTVPPQEGSEWYGIYRILSAVFASFASGVMVALFIFAEKNRRH